MSVPRSAHVPDGPISPRRAEPQPISTSLANDGYGPGGERPGLLSRLAFDAELVLLLCLFLALCVWFTVSRPIPRPLVDLKDHIRQSPPALLAAPRPREVTYARFEFAGTNGFLSQVQIAGPLPLAAPPPASAELAAVGEAAPAVENHALLAGPGFDPLGSVLLTGLPEGLHLSAGAQLSSRDWAVAFGDLDNLVIRLPPDRTAPLRTTFDLRTRSGAKIHSFTVEVQDAPAGTPLETSSTRPRERSLPAKSSRPAKKAQRKAEAKLTPPKPKSAAPEKSESPSQVAKMLPAPPQAAAPPKPSPSALAGVPLPPTPALGLFPPDPKDTATTGLAPNLRDDPRFTTLRGLGAKPGQME